MKAIVYTRVSSLAQNREDKVSLTQQAEACQTYAADKGYDVVDVVKEVKSAGTIRERPLLLETMRRVKEGEAEILLAYCLDRLTRQQSGIYTIEGTIQSRGRIEFATEEFEDTAIGRFTRAARAFVAEAELEKIAIRSAIGRQGRLANERLLVSANFRFGYRYAGDKKGRYEIDPMQAPVVQRIFADFVAGKSLSRIESELNAERVPTNSGKGRWHKPTVRNLLRSPAYIGEAIMMRTTYGEDGRSRVLRPPEDMVVLPEGTIPPIVDRLTFDRAQVRLQRNKADLVRPTASTDALLRGGFVSCGSCGRHMTVKRSYSGGRQQVRYICQYRDTCHLHVISAPLLDAGVGARVSTILSEPDKLRALLAQPERDLHAEIAATEQRIDELKREESNLARQLARLDENDAVVGPLLGAMREISERRRAQETAWEQLAEKGRDEEIRRDRIEATIAMIEQTGATELLDYDGKRQALSDLGAMVVVYPSWHESNYRWVMAAFEEYDGAKWPRVDGEALNLAGEGAASPPRHQSHLPVQNRTAYRTGSYSYACGEPSGRCRRRGARSWFAPAIGRGRGRDAPGG
jgi:site-specific DNA recombinase